MLRLHLRHRPTQTGGHGNWIYPAIGFTLMVIAGAMLVMMRRKK